MGMWLLPFSWVVGCQGCSYMLEGEVLDDSVELHYTVRILFFFL